MAERSPSLQRREQERQELRARILQAATELLVAEGLDKFSMRKLADRIGYTATALYFHFADKESLLGEVLDQRFIEFRQAFARMGRQKDPLRRLAQMGMAFVEFGLAQPAYYRLMFLTSWPSIPKGKLVEKGNPSQDCYAYLRTTVEEARQANLFRPEYRDAEQLAQIFFAGVHGIVSLHLVKGEDDWVPWRPVKPKAKQMIDALLRGLTVRDAIDPSSPGQPPPEFRTAPPSRRRRTLPTRGKS